MLIYIKKYGEISYDVTIHHYSTTYSLLLAIVAASAVPLSPPRPTMLAGIHCLPSWHHAAPAPLTICSYTFLIHLVFY
jgi:hypothetical protein